MKNKRLIILGLFIVLFSFSCMVREVKAQQGPTDGDCGLMDICYKPNIPIPIKITTPEGKIYDFAIENKITGGDFLASYIVAVYTYGAGFAGIVAMFMLVIAAWRWLFAAGNAQAINASKEMVQGTLMGLVLLFGGQLLLRQISSDFDSIQSIEVKLPEQALLGMAEHQAFEDAELAKMCANIEGCGDYNLDQCEYDPCMFMKVITTVTPNGTTTVPNYSTACVLGIGLVWDDCMTCPSSCTCANYADAWHVKEDRCDCDKDGYGGKHNPDPDGCVEKSS